MKNIKWIFVFYSIAAVVSISSIGLTIAMQSIPLTLLAIFAVIIIMGNGFKTKKKMREAGTL